MNHPTSFFIGLLLLCNGLFALYTGFFSEAPPERTVRDIAGNTQAACSTHKGVRHTSVADTRRGNIASIVVTCNDNTTHEVSPTNPNPAYLEYQKDHPIKGNESLLILMIGYCVISMLGGIFGIALVITSFDKVY